MNLLIYFLFALITLSAVLVVTVRNLFYSALSLVLALFLTAGLFICLAAEFLAVIQLLLYVGAVMMLILFAVMLTSRISDQTIRASNHQKFAAFFGLALFGVFLVRIIGRTTWPQAHQPNAAVSAGQLGVSLTGSFVFPFEIASVILIAALVGAVMIARDK
jgi:NADH-quinone oxidoreductase subunit J